MSEAFDHIPFEDLEQPFTILGSGSFGSVYRSTYLGLPVALKQITPSKDYDVQKYFEREWRLMREARHPNVVLYLGLSKSPPDAPKNPGVVYIVSEYVDGGNVRTYIHDKRKPFPWSMRLSFATDVARALAYLHARKCIHRDLKPENLLLTSNLRLKITDFGFARIAPRSTDEQKRLTYCGTDSYMSPEILMGDSFGIATDIFSLGIIFTEIMSRTLADDNNFKRAAPSWSIDPSEVKKKANPGCPPAFADLAVECMRFHPSERPSMLAILDRLRTIEVAVFERDGEHDAHVGSVKFATGGRRPKMKPRIPSFGAMIGGVDTAAAVAAVPPRAEQKPADDGGDDSDSTDEDELEAALRHLEVANAKGLRDYNGNAVAPHEQEHTETIPPSMSSILTIRPSDIEGANRPQPMDIPLADASMRDANMTKGSAMSVDSFHTASGSSDAGSDSGGSQLSVAAATLSSTLRSLPQTVAPTLRDQTNGNGGETHTRSMFHRFTMIKPGTKTNVVQNHNKRNSFQTKASSNGSTDPISKKRSSSGLGLSDAFGWNPFDFLLGRSSKSKVVAINSSGGNAGSGADTNPANAKCDLCQKRLGVGFRTVLECDDCGIRVHVKCGEFAPKDCNLLRELQLENPPLSVPHTVAETPVGPTKRYPTRHQQALATAATAGAQKTRR